MIGTTAVGGISLRRRRGFTIGVVLGAALPLLLVGVALIAGGGGSTGPSADDAPVEAERRALAAFEEDLAPLVEAGASIVVYGMRPGIDDIASGRFDDETLVTMATNWVETMRPVRDDFAALTIPAFLSEIAQGYERAFAAYVETAEALLEAARATGDERATAITRAATHGERADAFYEEAEMFLQEQRQRLGLAGDTG